MCTAALSHVAEKRNGTVPPPLGFTVPSGAVPTTPSHSLLDDRLLSGAFHSISLLSQASVTVKARSRIASVGSIDFGGVISTFCLQPLWDWAAPLAFQQGPGGEAGLAPYFRANAATLRDAGEAEVRQTCVTIPQTSRQCIAGAPCQHPLDRRRPLRVPPPRPPRRVPPRCSPRPR